MLKRLTPLFFSLSFVLCFSFVSCGRFAGEKEEAEEALFYEERKFEARVAPPEPKRTAAAADMEARAETTAPAIEERKRVYSGYAKIRVDSVEKRKNELFRIAERSGGYVESALNNTVVIRVPAESFKEILQMILDLGEVLEKREETFDVTEYFRDLETRISILRQTRTRLYTLLEKTNDVEERVKILREIRRLTEEIENIEGNLRLIEEQIAFSRITLELVSRLPLEEQIRDRIPFPWISELDPLYVSLPDLKGSIELDLGERFAVFTKDEAFRAESARGIRVRVGTVRNRPEGNDEFWQKAIMYHLEPHYRSAEKFEAGPMRAVFFTSKDVEAFFYLVGVHVRKTHIYVVEVFFPDEASMRESKEKILSALEQMRIR